MFKKYLVVTIIVLPMLILLFGGSYFAYESWEKYTKNNSLKIQLENTKLLQSLEYSVLNEIVCVATISQDEELMNKICDPTKKTTDSVMQAILTQQENDSLYALEKEILNIRNAIENNGNMAVEKLVNGDLDKDMHTVIKKYNLALKPNSSQDSDKRMIQAFIKMSDISYATASEKALVSYYLALKKAIPAANLIYWDESVSRSSLLESNVGNIPYLEPYMQDESFQALLREIEDVRIDVMSYASSGFYKYNVATWVGLINKKQKVLSSVDTKLLGNIYDSVAKANEKVLMTFLLSLGAILLSLLGLWLFLSVSRHKNKDNKSLTNLLTKVSQLTADGKTINVSNDAASQKIAYDYIASSFETLHDKESKSDSDNKANTIFLNNISYEIRTPLNGISGYTKLLKETPLDHEQNDYVSVIENSFDNLNTILSKISNDTQVSTQKLEIENNTFDMVKTIELAIETYTMKADQKDILLGVYIDPSLSYKVKGDSTKLLHILTNLIDNALEASNAYDTVDIFVENVHCDSDLVTIKFSIQDQGIGYTAEELAQIKRAFTENNYIETIANFDIKNLSISNKIIKRMGGQLELESKKGEGTHFFFTLNFEKDKNADAELYPTFEGMKVGLALPVEDINRQVDDNLAAYVKYLGAEFKIYYYDTLFDNDEAIELPDLMLFYHNYTRLEGELEASSSLACKKALITSGTLRSRINSHKYAFSSIVYGPITMRKVIRIFAESKLDTPQLIEQEVEETIVKSQKFENIHALVVEDNAITQKIISNVLKSFSVDVTIVTDGQKAFELRREQDFNIIFMDMDMDMPIMNGFEATSKILYYEGVNQLNHVPIISLGAVVPPKGTEKKSGIDDFITKPFDAVKIYDTIQKYCIDIPLKMKAKEEDDFIAKVLSEDFLKEDS